MKVNQHSLTLPRTQGFFRGTVSSPFNDCAGVNLVVLMVGEYTYILWLTDMNSPGDISSITTLFPHSSMLIIDVTIYTACIY